MRLRLRLPTSRMRVSGDGGAVVGDVEMLMMRG